MHLALFGGSGRTGQLLTEGALAQGHTLSVLVRKPAGYPYATRVKVIEGDAFTPSAIAQTLVSADAVRSAAKESPAGCSARWVASESCMALEIA